MHRLTADARDERGFSLIEMMVASVVMLIVLAEAMTAFDHAVRANETVTLLADSNQALRSGTQFIVRDLLQAAPGAVAAAKDLVRSVHGRPAQSVRDLICERIAERRDKPISL